MKSIPSDPVKVRTTMRLTMRRTPLLIAACSLLFAADPWTSSDVVRPEQVAPSLAPTNAAGPLVIYVGSLAEYRAAHIAGSIYAGPTSEPEGLADLRSEMAGQPTSEEVILYCGCCPWDKCPNIHPAFAKLHEMGYTKVKVMMITENLKADWIDKGFPTEKGAGVASE